MHMVEEGDRVQQGLNTAEILTINKLYTMAKFLDLRKLIIHKSQWLELGQSLVQE